MGRRQLFQNCLAAACAQPVTSPPFKVCQGALAMVQGTVIGHHNAQDAEREGTDLHGVCLACAGLPVGKDGAVEALQHLFHDGRNGHLVYLGLPCLRVKHLQCIHSQA